MNRAEKTADYLYKKLKAFQNYEQLGEAKQAFFDSIKDFKNEVIAKLKRTKIISPKELQGLEEILTKIETHRNQGGPSPYGRVYWNGTRPDYTEAQKIINNLILNLENRRLPIRINISDLNPWKST